MGWGGVGFKAAVPPPPPPPAPPCLPALLSCSVCWLSATAIALAGRHDGLCSPQHSQSPRCLGICCVARTRAPAAQARCSSLAAAGKPPFNGANHLQLVQNIERGEAIIPDHIARNLSGACRWAGGRAGNGAPGLMLPSQPLRRPISTLSSSTTIPAAIAVQPVYSLLRVPPPPCLQVIPLNICIPTYTLRGVATATPATHCRCLLQAAGAPAASAQPH